MLDKMISQLNAIQNYIDLYGRIPSGIHGSTMKEIVAEMRQTLEKLETKANKS